MKLSGLKRRIAELEDTVARLELVKGTHFSKRPDEWRGKALELSEQLDAARGELKELRAWLRGNWYEDDIGAGGGSTCQLLRAG